MSSTYEQAWDEVYGTPEAWERERHGTVHQAEREASLPTGRRWRFTRGENGQLYVYLRREERRA